MVGCSCSRNFIHKSGHSLMEKNYNSVWVQSFITHYSTATTTLNQIIFSECVSIEGPFDRKEASLQIIQITLGCFQSHPAHYNICNKESSWCAWTASARKCIYLSSNSLQNVKSLGIFILMTMISRRQ